MVIQYVCANKNHGSCECGSFDHRKCVGVSGF